MIRHLIFNVGTVVSLAVEGLRARADRLAKLEAEARGLRNQVRWAREGAQQMAAVIDGLRAELAEAEQRCNLLAHRVEEAESDVRRWKEAARTNAELRYAAKVEASGARVWAARWKRLACEMREQRNLARASRGYDSKVLREHITKAREERDAAQAKLATILRGEDANRAQEGES